MAFLNGILYPSERFIGGIGLQRPDSPVLGGIQGNVVPTMCHFYMWRSKIDFFPIADTCMVFIMKLHFR